MTCFSLDLTLDAALADPMIAAAMRADRVDPRTFEQLLRAAARDLDGARRSEPRSLFADRARGAAMGSVSQW